MSLGKLWILSEIPWHLLTNTPSKKWPLSARGQQLMWASAADGGLQGVTELVQCERTQDKWLQELQAELRIGRLSQANHAFLHGQPTPVPGSWLASLSAPACGEIICRQLYANHASPTTIMENECIVCVQERKSKRLVATGPTDPRFTNEFVRAQAVFGTNVVKCHVNRVRAEHWARSNNRPLCYAVARDVASSEVLHTKPNLAQEKLSWLQRSDADCGDRCGVLPLCMGMPVQARDHLHRGEFKILKGCHGYVVGWSATAAEEHTSTGDVIWNQLPQFVFVRFETRATWRLDAVGENNVFPVAVSRKAWFLDCGRNNPKLKITRSQYPLAPDFAGTAHALQGSTTEHGAIIDVEGNVDPLGVYVGMTRSRSREKVLIYRPFPLVPFQTGIPLGRQLLLDVWNQTPINWNALKAKYLEEKLCVECDEMKRKDAFTKPQWRQDAHRVCKECTTQKRAEGTPYRCTRCGLWRPCENFSRAHCNPRCALSRVCTKCDNIRQCFACKKKLTEKDFNPSAWRARKPARRICLHCQRKSRGRWLCATCQRKKPLEEFPAFSAQRSSGQDGTQTCNACTAEATQKNVRKRAAQTTLIRLAPRRKKLRHQEAMVATWAAIAGLNRRKCTATSEELTSRDTIPAPSPASPALDALSRCLPPTESEHSALCRPHKPDMQPPDETKEKFANAYRCPFCQQPCYSLVRTGRIDHRSHCGKQFWVKDGVITGRIYQHKCPKCGATVASSKTSGQLRVSHKNPAGRPCPCVTWQLKK